MAKSTFDLIYDVVKQIPKGCVASYGQVAALAGSKRWSRVVGYALHANPDPELLEADGVEFIDGHVDMDKYQWDIPWE